MSVRILYGPKKRTLTEIFIKEIDNAIASNNPSRLIVIIPEQYSSYYEEQLAKDKGFMKIEVMTFSRLTQRLFDIEYLNRDNAINDSGRTMLMYSLLNKQDINLEYYNRSRHYPGFSVLAKQTIEELKTNCIGYEDIRRISMENDLSDSTQKKFNEIASIYEHYNLSLNEIGLTDQTDAYSLLSEHINNSTAFNNCIIWFDRFESFSASEFNIIKQLMQKAERINISLCIDYSMNIPDNEIFESPLSTLRKVKKEADTKAVTYIEEKCLLDPVFENNEINTLDFLFQNLFSSRHNKFEGIPENIEIFKANDIYDETEYAAIRIMDSVMNRGLRYKDILCVASDIQSYERIIKAVFDQYEIPFYVNTRRTIADNPLIKFFISILDIYIWDFDTSYISKFIKNMYSIIEIADAQRLENYIIKWGISTKKTWYNVWNYENSTYDSVMDDLRMNIISFLNPFFKSVKNGCKPVEFASYFYKLVEKSGVFEKIIEEKNYLDINESEQARQCYNSFIDILDQMVVMLQNEKKSVEFYMNILKSAFLETTVGVTPMTKDCVFLTNTKRTDILEYDTVIVLGVNEGIFPLESEAKSLLNDSDIEIIKDNGFDISKDPKNQVNKEEYLVYELIQSPKKNMHFSYHESNSDGSNANISVWLLKILDIFPELSIITKQDIPKNAYIYNLKTAFPVLFPSNSYYKEYYKGTDFDKLFAHIDDSVQITNKDTSKLLFGNNIIMSPTMLEQYVKCPYSFLMKYGLKLEERCEFEYFSSNLGTMKHSILFDTMYKVCNEDKEYTYDDIYLICEQSAEKITKSNNIYKRDSVLEYVKKRAVQQTADTVINSLNILKDEKLKPKLLEVKFDESMPIDPVMLDVNDLKIKVVGKIDRIDVGESNGEEYFRVIDYKTSDNDTALYKIQYGYDIQLALYAYAYYKFKKAKLLGMYYLTIDHDFAEVKNTEDRSYQDKRKVMAGYSFNDNYDTLYSMINIDNVMKNRVLDNNIELKIYESIEKTIKNSAQDISDGKFEAHPLKDKDFTACQYCSYAMICGFDSKESGFRKVKPLKDEEVKW